MNLKQYLMKLKNWNQKFENTKIDMNGLTNRQFALLMAIEARKIKFQGGIYDNAEDFYNWLEEEKKIKKENQNSKN
jgi:hypothetical protein